MDGAWLPFAVAAPFIAILACSGVWANRRFSAFNELPGHFDFAGRVTRMSPRLTMVWLLPAVFSIFLIALAAIASLAPAGDQPGGSILSIILCGGVMLAGQALYLWLTVRWTRSQR